MNDPIFTYLMVAMLVMLVFFMMRNSRKQKADREALQNKIVAGAKVMTTAGIFGTIVSINEEANEILLESAPGTKLRLHRQAIASVVDDAVAPAASATKRSSAKSTASKPTA